MSRIIINIGTLSAGGAERVVSILTKPIADKFDEVEIILWHHLPIHYTIDPRVKITFLPDLSKTESRLKNMRFFRNYIKQQRPDLLLSFLTPFNMLAIVSLFGCNIRTVVCERNDPHFIKGGKFMESIRNFLYRFADGALVQTKYGLSCYPAYIRKKMKVIYNPVIMEDSLIGKAINEAKENLFVSVGRLEPQKNQKMLIRAFAKFCNTHSDYRLIIYGDGSMRGDLEAYINNLGLQDKVKLPGSCRDIWQKLLPAKAFILSSDAEGMSNALIEAMCLGLPVVSTKVSGSTDLIVNGGNGILVNLGDEDGMYKAMCKIVDNEDQSIEMGNNASHIYSLLKEDEIAKQWIAYLDGVIYGGN